MILEFALCTNQS